MKFKVEKRKLQNLVGKTQNIVEKRNTMPILVNILLETSGSELKVFATDLEVSLTDSIDAEVSEPGKIAVSAKSLFDIVKELGEGDIEFEKQENNWLQIKQNKYTSKIVGVSSEEYPVFPTYSSNDFLKMDSEVLKDMIEKTIYSVSNDETRYHLNGVFFEKDGSAENSFRMVATDGHRLSVVDRNFESQGSGNFNQGVIIPRKGLNEIKKMLDTVEGVVELAVEGSQLIIRNDSALLMIRLIEGKYPNYQQLIPQNLANRVVIEREAFLHSLRRVSLLSNHKSKGVTFNFSPNKLEIVSNNPEIGDAKEELDINYEGSEIKVGFNAKYILDVLNSFGTEDVDFQLNDQLSPGMIRPSEDSSYTCVVMPMKI